MHAGPSDNGVDAGNGFRSSVFTPRYSLFASNRLQRIDSRGAAGGDEAGHQRDREDWSGKSLRHRHLVLISEH